ncbi:hypothetical protein [Hymenobacter sp. HDW8]|uniref:hypothetical protein n=1 Tax=Hymenobacter sp. HDW8 TaxID=2714932 RepID=UPI00140D8A33|nr:hypothetical protein [Hymenobacter sp. HDW8]QIL77261.1 hypothetical protein G7064_16465 [Hymenobacter sp. HDW8]
MELKDLFLTPLYLGIFYAFAFALRPRFTNVLTKKYFIPALSLKFLGAIALGLIYQFYYDGGDTYNYFYHSTIMHEAFDKSWATGIKLLTSDGVKSSDIANYTSRMYWFEPGSSEMVIVRIATVIGMLCFNTYTVVALIFAIISFSGMWAMFLTFMKIRPQVYKQLAIVVFFIPSVFFWGSGLMKDSLCIGALGWIFYTFYEGAIEKKNLVRNLILGGLAAYFLSITKVYILLSFLPPAVLWVFNENSQRIRNQLIRILAKPILLSMGAVIAVYAMTNLTKGDEKYDLDKIGERSKITSDYLYEVSVKQDGSAYSLGEQDGSLGGMVKLVPQAIVVSLFRPFLWEARNPVMLLSALEATFFLIFTLRMLFNIGPRRFLNYIVRTPVLSLCIVFALIFGASVGIISYNFGTLVRYKIPLIPFYLAALYIMQSLSQQPSKPKIRRRIPPTQRRLATVS